MGAALGDALAALAAGSHGGLGGLVIGAVFMPIAAMGGAVQASRENTTRAQAAPDAAMQDGLAPPGRAGESSPAPPIGPPPEVDGF